MNKRWQNEKWKTEKENVKEKWEKIKKKMI